MIKYGSDNVDFMWYPGYTCPVTGIQVPERGKPGPECDCFVCSYPSENDNAHAEYDLDCEAVMREATATREEMTRERMTLRRGWPGGRDGGPDFIDLSWHFTWNTI